MIQRYLCLLSLPSATTLAFLPPLLVRHREGGSSLAFTTSGTSTCGLKERAVGHELSVEAGFNDSEDCQGAAAGLQRDMLSDVIVYCRDYREWVPNSKRSQESKIPKLRTDEMPHWMYQCRSSTDLDDVYACTENENVSGDEVWRQ